MSRTAYARWLPVVSAANIALQLCACSAQLDGPTPILGTSKSLAIAPAIACGEQLTTTLDLHGQHFSPLPVNIPDKPLLALPSLTLTRASALDGSSASALTLVYDGDPTRTSNSAALRFLDETHMQFTLDDKQGRLESGLYDARVTNPNGAGQTSRGALVVVDRPVLAPPTAAVACLEQGARELSIGGAGLLRVADALPSLRISGQDEARALDTLTDCSAVPGNHVDAELCHSATFTLDRATLEPGRYDVTLTNPEPAACHSEETLQLRVVPAPKLDSNRLAAACVDNQLRTVVIRGEGFLEIDGAMPRVKLGDQTVSVNALADCEQLELEGLSVRSCKRIEVAVVGLAFSAETNVVVENPAPAGCSVSARAELRANMRESGSGPNKCETP